MCHDPAWEDVLDGDTASWYLTKFNLTSGVLVPFFKVEGPCNDIPSFDTKEYKPDPIDPYQRTEFKQQKPLPIRDRKVCDSLEYIRNFCSAQKSKLVPLKECKKTGSLKETIMKVRTLLMTYIRHTVYHKEKGVLRGYMYDLQPKDQE